MKRYSKRPKVKREQPVKDSKSKRVNFDNTRKDVFDRDIAKEVDEMRKKSGYKNDKSNDISWYARNPQMLKAAATFGFGTTAGMPIYRGVTTTPGWASESVAGVLAMYWDPAIGFGSNKRIVKQAQDMLYSYVVHANSRNEKYDAVDLMTMYIASALTFQWLAYGIRTYGTMKSFSEQNFYTPKALITAMGFDYDDLQANLANMWFDLNNLIAKSTQLWIPNDLPFVKRWFWMNSNVYRDGESTKAQYYMFVPSYAYVYTETGSTEGATLRQTELKYNDDGTPTTGSPLQMSPSVKMKWSDYMILANKMFDALMDSQDRGIIFGDVLKAYGADKLYAINEITSDFRVLPVYDREVLTQIENATIFGGSSGHIAPTIDGYFTRQGAISSIDIMSNGGLQYKALNFHQLSDPTPEQIMIATRLTTMGAEISKQSTSSAMYYVHPAIVGTEYITQAVMITNTFQGDTNTPVMKWDNIPPSFYNGTELTVDKWREFGDKLALWSQFDWAPALYTNYVKSFSAVTTTTPTMRTFVPNNVYWEPDNYAGVMGSDIEKCHTVAILSEFGVPVL